ncbi:redoxin domain-containing protein [Gryllotalpicola reticulitermitis]|uniref:Redoxin domain-containing protein n=1 Tax=Gryllotalpicola reticulitermitis TaxID=1184153 RepID=A0ABV8Q4B8_9MICO
MTDHPQRPPRRNAWMLWTGAGVVLALVAVLIIVAMTGAGSAGAASSGGDDYLRAGLNKPTADLLALDPMTDEGTVKAPTVDLTDENGAPLTLAQFRGKVAIVTVNDDRCTDECALFAQDIQAADKDLTAAERADIAFVSINANPYYPTPADELAWSTQHGLSSLSNWHYGTGTPAQLSKTWNAWGEPVELDAKTRTVQHGTDIFVVGPNGDEVDLAQFGDGSADTAPFGHGLAQLAVDALPSSERGHVAGSDLPAPLPGGTGVGDTPPAVTLPKLTGAGTVSTSSDRGKYTVLNFWASSCSACTTEMPDFEREYSELGGKVAFLGVDVSDATDAARTFAAKYGVSYPLVSDTKGATAGRFRVTGLPYTVILSPTGKVLIRHPGAFTHDELDFVLDDLDTSLPPTTS